jgi:ABC-type nitrate/sulfonate/bicarbonate transport system permease component
MSAHHKRHLSSGLVIAGEHLGCHCAVLTGPTVSLNSSLLQLMSPFVQVLRQLAH